HIAPPAHARRHPHCHRSTTAPPISLSLPTSLAARQWAARTTRWARKSKQRERPPRPSTCVAPRRHSQIHHGSHTVHLSPRLISKSRSELQAKSPGFHENCSCWSYGMDL
uniref:Uncharacterized protein n=1 Tax=Aegilops tauschii subsp. strangulata TaxID=200361 RepID=A0A453FC80_AEGTS